MILTIAVTLCYKTPGFFVFDICCFLQRKPKYANGVDSKIIRNLKSRSLHVAELYSGFKNLKVGHSSQAAYYFTVHGSFLDRPPSGQSTDQI